MNIVLFDTDPNLVNSYGDAAIELGVNPIFISSRQDKAEDCRYSVEILDINTSYNAVKDYLKSTVKQVDVLISLDDRSVIPVSRLSEEFGVQLNSYQSVICNRDKAEMKLLWEESAILTAKSKLIMDLKNVDIAPLKYPLIIKPLMGFASSGVVKINDDNKLMEYIKLLDVVSSLYYDCSKSRDKGVILEEFIDGYEYAVDSLWKNGTPVAHFISSKDNPQGPLFKDHIYIVDPYIESDVKNALIEAVTKVVAASNYKTGATHIEMRINHKGCYVIESACRPGGGGILYKVYSDAYDVNVFKLFLGLYLKDDVEKKNKYVPKKLSMLYIVPQTDKGVIKEIQGLQEILDLKEIFDYIIIKEPGDKLLREDINLEYIAFLCASYDGVGKNKAYAIEKASYYDNQIKVICN